MNHATEEQLILHYYGEEGDPAAPSEALATEQHLEECGACRELYASLVRVLNVVDSLPVPERSEDYGAQVWKRIERRLPVRSRFAWLMPTPIRWATAGVVFAGLMVAAFFAGRTYPGARGPGQPQAAPAVTADAQTRERILLVAVGDYLERSQMVLVELANSSAKGPLDISSEQERAGDLVTESRLYRQTAAHTGDTRISSVLDELEPVLVDIARGPSRMSPRELQNLRQRLEAEGILFKIRVLGSNVRNQDVPAAQTAGHTL
jgi:anti-sigma factor RsiW